jgi:PEP-CTERM motif-containing protein
VVRTLRSWLSRAVIASAVLALAGPAGAVATGIRLSVSDGESTGNYFLLLGCTAGADGNVCQGSDLDVGGVRLESWNLTFDGDPVVSGPIVVTNTTNAAEQLSFGFTLPVAPSIPISSLTGGSIQGGVQDNDGDGATVATIPGGSLYRALIDGATYQTLYDAPQSFSAGSFLSGNIPNLAFGAPIPSQAGPAVNTSIGLVLSFSLSPHDSASITSNFVVQPPTVDSTTPEPGTGALFGLGLLALGMRSRRTRAS